jgi:hypothetical protein
LNEPLKGEITMAGEKPASEAIDPSFFLNLENGHWWEFKNESTGGLARVECQTAGSTITVRIKVGDQVTEQMLVTTEVPDEQTGQQIRQYTLLESRVPAQHLVIKWKGGLILPPKWAVETTVSATSEPGANPATGNPVKVTATLVRLGEFKPPAPRLFGVEIKQTVQDVGLGAILGKVQMYFAGSRGLVFAMGQTFGPQFVLQPTSWYGQH